MKKESEIYTAIVLAAGSGKRMQTKVHKQYLDLLGKPVLYYALKAFEDSAVDEIILVTGKGEISYCQTEIVDRYGFKKVTHIVEGGKERYHSVYEGLKCAAGANYVLIHDGARPFVNEQILQSVMESVQENGACVTGVPVKDTIKIADGEGYAVETPDRNYVWAVQTPQAFSYGLIADAYTKLMAAEDPTVTDDAMVIEKMTGKKVKLVPGSYRNIKITTPEDLIVAEAYLRHQQEK